MKIAKDYFDIILGSTVFSLSVAWFADPMELVIGGISGLAIIIKWLSNDLIPLFITNLILNIPLFIISIKQRGFKFILKSLISVIWMSIILEAAVYIKNPLDVSDDILLTSLLTGLFSGVGLGLILRSGATSGGTDMIASIFKKIKPHCDISKLLFITDLIIILIGISVFGVTKGIYGIIAIFVSMLTINLFLDGAHFGRGVFILSDKYEEISKEIFTKLERGNTGISAQGMYTKKDKKMLFAVVNPKEIVKLQNIVRNIDNEAFMVIFDVRRTLGKGFFDLNKTDSL
ncbi:MAG: YitT family protein [Clostridia bacterium]|nr:YitT family protein [Oscillospiraceae bacterium]MBR4892581.1 YitT family protein [Clostridia bacterium]